MASKPYVTHFKNELTHCLWFHGFNRGRTYIEDILEDGLLTKKEIKKIIYNLAKSKLNSFQEPGYSTVSGRLNVVDQLMPKGVEETQEEIERLRRTSKKLPPKKLKLREFIKIVSKDKVLGE
jgi:hypothetical protein